MAKQDACIQLERLARDLHDLIFEVQEQRSANDFERNEEEGQRIADAIRCAFRG
jgi:hypothetical protein